MTDNIKEKTSLEYNDEKLSYVRDLVEKHLPMTDFDDNGNTILLYSLSSLISFTKRYNSNAIAYTFKYEDYKNNNEIQRILLGFGYDPEKIWYLLLFIFDYSYEYCLDGIVWREAPRVQLEKLINAIDENTMDTAIDGNPAFNNEAKLILNIKGKHNITLDNPLAIYYLACFCDAELKRTSPVSILDISTELIPDDSISNSVHIWFFAKMFHAFFSLRPPKKIKSPKGENKPYNKNLLISNFIYFTRLSKNQSLLHSDEPLKGILNQYKNYELKTSSQNYSDKWI